MSAAQKQDMRVLMYTSVGIALFPALVLNVGSVTHYLDIMVFVGIFSLVNIGLSLVMGYAGPRMTYRYPWLSLLHLFDKFRRVPTLSSLRQHKKSGSG